MQLKRTQKILYGMGDFGFSLSMTFIATNFLFFMTGPAGIPMAMASLVLFIGKTFEYLGDPVVGYLSDRTRSRWGRRRPFLLWGAIPYGVSFALLWIGGQQAGVPLWYYFVTYAVFLIVASFNYIPYYTLTPEISGDYDERTSLTSYRMVFSILGSLIAFAIPLPFASESADKSGGSTTGDVFIIAILVGVVSAAVLLAVFFSSRERSDALEQRKDSLRATLKSARGNKTFLFSGGIFVLTWTAMEVLMAMVKYYIAFVARQEDNSIVIMLSIFLTALASLPLWNLLVQKLNKSSAYLIGAVLTSAALITLSFFNADFPLAAIVAVAIVGGIGVGAAHLIPWAMLPDAVEVDELESGARHEGAYYALITLVQKVSSSIAVPLVGLVLAIMGFAEGALVQNAGAQWGIRIAFALVPAALLLLACVLALRYPLSRSEHARIVQELEARKQAKS